MRSRREDSALVVEVRGDIDLATVGELREAVAAADAGGDGGRVVLDLRGVDFMDTSGVRLIVELVRGEEAGGAQLWLVAGHDPVMRLLDMAGLTARLRFAPSVGEALA